MINQSLEHVQNQDQLEMSRGPLEINGKITGQDSDKTMNEELDSTIMVGIGGKDSADCENTAQHKSSPVPRLTSSRHLSSDTNNDKTNVNIVDSQRPIPRPYHRQLPASTTHHLTYNQSHHTHARLLQKDTQINRLILAQAPSHPRLATTPTITPILNHQQKQQQQHQRVTPNNINMNATMLVSSKRLSITQRPCCLRQQRKGAHRRQNVARSAASQQRHLVASANPVCVIPASEYKNLRQVVPSLKRQRDVGKVEVVTEAARYIDHLHKTLIERFIIGGIPDSLKELLGTDNAKELNSNHIMRLVTRMAQQQQQQQHQSATNQTIDDTVI